MGTFGCPDCSNFATNSNECVVIMGPNQVKKVSCYDEAKYICTKPGGCQEGFHKIPKIGGCFKQLTNSYDTIFEMEQQCNLMGASLPTPTSEKQLENFKEILPNFYLVNFDG